MKLVTKNILNASALSMAFAFGANPAAAATYIGFSNVGLGTVDVQITTDDTIGALTQANIIDWVISIMDGQGGSFVLTGPLSGNNSRVDSSLSAAGDGALTATATDLIYDFGDGLRDNGAFLLFQEASIVGRFYCLQTNRCFDSEGPAAAFNIATNGGQRSTRLGPVSIGTVAVAGAVPEPATWAFMIFGFGAIGGAMRRQRKANVKVSYA